VIRVPQIVVSGPSKSNSFDSCIAIPSTKVKYTYYDPEKSTAFENQTYMFVSEAGDELVFTFINAPLIGPI
jgi:hypothetical protein